MSRCRAGSPIRTRGSCGQGNSRRRTPMSRMRTGPAGAVDVELQPAQALEIERLEGVDALRRRRSGSRNRSGC